MAASKGGLLQGTLDLLVLRALSLGPDHGLGIARRVGQITRGAFDVKPGSRCFTNDRVGKNASEMFIEHVVERHV